MASLSTRGETYDERGRLITALPGEVYDCDAVIVVEVAVGWHNAGTAPRATRQLKTPAQHPQSCKCGGTGTLVVRRPAADLVQTSDDSLPALYEALASRGARTDVYLGDTVKHLMEREPTGHHATSKGSRGRTKQQKRGEPHPKTADDGLREKYREIPLGRKPRFVETRRAKINLSIARETKAIMVEHEIDLPEAAELIRANPDFLAAQIAQHLAIIAQQEAENASNSVQATP